MYTQGPYTKGFFEKQQYCSVWFIWIMNHSSPIAYLYIIYVLCGFRILDLCVGIVKQCEQTGAENRFKCAN